MRIIERTYEWARPLVRRKGAPKGFKVHHAAAAQASPDDIHRWHLGRGWKGFGYHYEIGTDGTITRGRPEWAIGSHTLGINDALGVVLEGNFEVSPPTEAQLASLSWLYHTHVKGQWPKLKASRHRDHAATACPGRFMPWPIRPVVQGSLLSPGTTGRPTVVPFPLPRGHAFGAAGTGRVRNGRESPVMRAHVRRIQERLIARGHRIPDGPIGIFGPQTRAAVTAFQRGQGIRADGLVGPITWGRLMR